MAYEDPTPADLKARFPAFTGVGDDVADGALDEAKRRVDRTWPEGDFKLARLLYAAHVLAIDGHGAGMEAELARAGALGFKKYRSGPLSLERGDGASSSGAASGGLSQTSYGQRFLEMVRRNFPAVLVV